MKMCQTQREYRLTILLLLGHGTSNKQWKEVKVGKGNTISEVYG